MIDTSTWVYDIECYWNYFCLCAININTKQKAEFVIYGDEHDTSNNIDDRIKLYNWLFNTKHSKVKMMIGFNNLSYDYPVLHEAIYKNRSYFLSGKIDGVLKHIKRISNEVISNDFTEIRDKDRVLQTDLYRIYHFDNKARTCSLKKLEFVMMMDDVSDLPYPHDKPVKKHEADHLTAYCHHDVNATFKFYNKAINEGRIDFRKDISNEYGFECRNHNDVKIGSEIFLKLLSQDMNVNSWDLKKTRTYVDQVILKDCIPGDVYFNAPEFNRILESLKKKRVSTTRGAVDEHCYYGGIKFDFGVGGLHAITNPGVYEPADDERLLSFDVKSYYPNQILKSITLQRNHEK